MIKKEWKELGYINEPIAKDIDLKAEIRRMCKEKNAVILATDRGRRMADATPLYSHAPTTPAASAASADRPIDISPFLTASMIT